MAWPKHPNKARTRREEFEPSATQIKGEAYLSYVILLIKMTKLGQWFHNSGGGFLLPL